MTLDKTMTLSEAVTQMIAPGMTIHLGYSSARPNAAVMEIVRQFAGKNPGFVLSCAGLVSSQAPLVTENLVKRVIASFVGDNYPTGGPNPIFQAAIDEGRVELESWSLWTLVARLVAGAMNVPFFPVNSITGSSLEELRGFATTEDPFSGAKVGVVEALVPDVVLIHAIAGDAAGNLLLSAPYGETHWGALAAKNGVLATVERIISHEELLRHQALARIPGHVVKAVCQAPLGSHPYGLYSSARDLPGYPEDDAFILEQRRLSKDTDAMRAWTRDWVIDLEDHDAYLDKLGASRVHELLGAASADGWTFDTGSPDDSVEGWSSEEALVALTSRRILERVADQRYELLMAGIGFANLASWLAQRTLKDGSQPIQLMAEIGLYGFDPRDGDPFIFSSRNLPTASVMTDVMGILGTLVGGDRGRCLAALGAGQIDATGAINSSRTDSGGHLVGSGGANDIASAAAEVIVAMKLGRRRLRRELPFVTCPGDRVRTVVAFPALLEKPSGSDEFVLTGCMPQAGETKEDCIQRVVELCEWELKVARDPQILPPPTREELDTMRALDPKRVFLGQVRPPAITT